MRKIRQGAEYEETLLDINEQLQAAEMDPVDSIERVIDALLDRYSVIAQTVKKMVVFAKSTPSEQQLQVCIAPSNVNY